MTLCTSIKSKCYKEDHVQSKELLGNVSVIY